MCSPSVSLSTTVPGIWHSAAVREQALHYKSGGICFCHPQPLPGHYLPVQLPATDLWRRPRLKRLLFPYMWHICLSAALFELWTWIHVQDDIRAIRFLMNHYFEVPPPLLFVHASNYLSKVKVICLFFAFGNLIYTILQLYIAPTSAWYLTVIAPVLWPFLFICFYISLGSAVTPPSYCVCFNSH